MGIGLLDRSGAAIPGSCHTSDMLYNHMQQEQQEQLPGSCLRGVALSAVLPRPPHAMLRLPDPGAGGPPRMDVHTSVELQQRPPVGRGAGSGDGGCRVCRADVLAVDVCSPSGRTLGRALMFDAWECGRDGRVGRPGMRELSMGEVPNPDAVLELQEAVRAQVREALGGLAHACGSGRVGEASMLQEVVRAQVREVCVCRGGGCMGVQHVGGRHVGCWCAGCFDVLGQSKL